MRYRWPSNFLTRWLYRWNECGWECRNIGERIPLRSYFAWFVVNRLGFWRWC